MIIVGVDNGLQGGLCAVSEFDGGIVDKIPMPTMQRSKKTEIDTAKIKKWLLPPVLGAMPCQLSRYNQVEEE